MFSSRKHQAHEAHMDAITAERQARVNGASKAEIRLLTQARIESARKYNEVEASSKKR